MTSPFLKFSEVMDLEIKIVGRILAKGLNHRNLRELLQEVDSEYSDLILNNAGWLSRGQVQKIFLNFLAGKSRVSRTDIRRVATGVLLYGRCHTKSELS